MKIHLCCGAIYLEGYTNCDVIGKIALGLKDNPNKTTLEKYFKEPFEIDPSKRRRKEYIIDLRMSPLEIWPFGANSVREIVMVSAFEHFEHKTEIPHIINEAYRVLQPDGIWKISVPDIYKQMNKYYGYDDEFLMELIYCNHKDKHSEHKWGYTRNSIGLYLTSDKWDIEFRDVVKHDYPMLGIWAKKK